MTALRQHSERMAILVEGRLSSLGLKMVIAALLYIPDRVVAVIDSTKERATTQQLIGYGGDTPIVHSLEEAMRYEPDSLLIGITPLGGELPERWKDIIREAAQRKLHIISALQQLLAHDAALMQAIAEAGVYVHDLRHVPQSHLIKAQGSWRLRKANTIVTMGTDSNTGKMTTALQICRELQRRGMNAAMIGTGPTGILISGRGLAVETVTSDFLTGAVEYELDKAVNEGAEWVVIEGQGAISHTGNAPIAMGILIGSMPDAIVLCHQPSRSLDGYGMPLPAVQASILLHEHLMSMFKNSKVVGIGINSIDLSTSELETTTAKLAEETGLPVVDPLRQSPAVLVDALLDYYAHYDRTDHSSGYVKVYDRIF